MLVGAKVCDLTEDLLWFVCGLYVGILTSSLNVYVYFRKKLFYSLFLSLPILFKIQQNNLYINL